MKRKVWISILFLAVLFGVAIVAASFFFDDGSVRFKERIGAAKPEGCIDGFATPTSFGHFVTDIIEYQITVTYCEGIEVDAERLLKEVDLSPFDVIGNIKILQRFFPNGINELVLSYTIQAIDVYPGEEYLFPNIPVEYSQKESVAGDVYWIDDVRPIYISKLTFPEPLIDGEKVEFHPIKSEIVPKQSVFSKKILLVIGSAIVVLGLIEFLHIIRPRRATRKSVKMSYREEVFSILEDIESQANHSARSALHRLHNLFLEIFDDARLLEHQESLKRLGEEISHVAYSKDEPTSEVAVEKIEKLKGILSRKKGGDS